MIKQKFQETSTFGMIRHGLKELGNYFWKYNFKSICNNFFNFHLNFVAQSFCLLLLLTWFARVDVAWWGNLKMFTIILQLLHLQGEVHIPCTTKKNKQMKRF
jgi:hypothetical protein